MPNTVSGTDGTAGILGIVAGLGADVFQWYSRCGYTSPMKLDVTFCLEQL